MYRRPRQEEAVFPAPVGRSMIEPAMKLACHLQILCVAIRGPTADSL
jgi:hypothetical protein